MEWCGLNNICGGCTYGGMEYEEQLEVKNQMLLETLLPCLDRDSVWEGTLASPLHTRYKNKMEYSFGDDIKDGPLTLGMHKKKSFYSVVTCDDCRIVHGDYNLIVKATAEYFGRLQVPYVHKKTHKGYLRHLLLRRSYYYGDIMLDLVTADMGDKYGGLTEQALLEGWRDCVLSLSLEGKISGILHTRNNSLSDAVVDQGTEILYGRDYLIEKLLGLQFKITPFSFFQTNSSGAEVLYGKVREYVGDTRGKVVYDLYSGTGTIAQLVAPVASKVYGVEIVEEAVESAKENAALNGLHNCEFIPGDVLSVIDSLETKPDMIILDPPRDGLHPKILPKLCAYGVEQIVYVACKPASFVRDMDFFRKAGYRVVKAAGVDQFPFTKHVETVVLMSKVK